MIQIPDLFVYLYDISKRRWTSRNLFEIIKRSEILTNNATRVNTLDVHIEQGINGLVSTCLRPLDVKPGPSYQGAATKEVRTNK